MRFQQISFQLLLSCLTGSIALFGVVLQAPTAQACGREVTAPATASDSNKTPGPNINLRLGMGEDELMKRFGKPQKRGWEPVRCPSNRLYLTYAKSIVVIQPKPGYKLDHRLESQHNYPQTASLAQAQTADERLNQAFGGNGNLMVIGFTSQDPKVVIEGGVRVGMPIADAQERLLKICDPQTFQSNSQSLSCQLSGEPIEAYFQQQQVVGLRVGIIRTASNEDSY